MNKIFTILLAALFITVAILIGDKGGNWINYLVTFLLAAAGVFIIKYPTP